MTSAAERLNVALADRYLVEREIGQGGMATVYLARDIRHDRQVAIKVLHPDLAASLGGERFLQEIRTTANLQHPHILGLIDSGQLRVRATDDDDGGQWLYYVMPYVDGESLRDRLNRERQLPVEDAIRIARETSSALDFAHRKGVIHRDIKPENILLQDGQALVADFGIALAVQSAGGQRMTQTGLSLGTPQYMAPEQAMGDKTIDARADVYAIGCVLYEMLTGEPPYTGPTVQAIVARLLTEEPRSVMVQRKAVPPHVEDAVLTALQKLPADRFATAAEFADALGNPSTALRAATHAGANTSTVHRSWRLRALAAAGLALLALVAAVAGWMRPSDNAPPVLTRTLMAMPDSTGWASGALTTMSMSADGGHFVFTSDGATGRSTRFMLKRRDQTHPVAIPGTEGAYLPMLSPDGGKVAFITLPLALRVLPTNGGTPVLLRQDGLYPGGHAWGGSEMLYFVHADSGIMRISTNGTGMAEQVVPIDRTDGDGVYTWPHVLPGGRGLLYIVGSTTGQQSSIAVFDARTRTSRKLMHGAAVAYAPSGHLVLVQDNGSLAAVRFDLAKLELQGDLVLLDDRVQLGLFGAPFLSVADDGTIVYRRVDGVAGEHNELVWFDRSGLVTDVDANWVNDFSALALSPDGKRLAISIRERGVRQVWLRDLERGQVTRFTFFAQESSSPFWTPDGRDVGFISNRDRQAVFIKPADGSREERVLWRWNRNIDRASISPDGQWLIVESDGSQHDIFAVRIGVDSLPLSVTSSPANETDARVSPDGRWIAYRSNESGLAEIYVRPFPDAASARWQISTQGGSFPHWSSDGRELLYTSSGSMMASTIERADTFKFSEPRRLFTFDGSNRWDVAPGGQRVIAVRNRRIARHLVEVVMLQGWTSLLEQKRELR